MTDKAAPEALAIGAELRRRREAAKLSQAELGRRIGVVAQQVSKYESGADRISCVALARAARALACRAGDFFPDELEPA